jgi:Rieske Fe-S protein
MDKQLSPPEGPPRRSFFSHAAAFVLGVGALVAPMGAGLAVLLDPVTRKTKSTGEKWIRIASLEQIPADGQPYAFPVIDPEPWDKWNRYEPQPVGSVYVIRQSETDLIAFSAVCPHLGCTFDYRPARNDFRCPCHNAMFGVDGKQVEGCTVSPRDLDPLEVKSDPQTGAVEVNYKRFKRGIRDRIEII